MAPLTRPTVAIETHGCKLNQADSTTLTSDFLRNGFQVVSTTEVPDVYVLNTCTVTHVADRKARQSLRAVRRLNPNATIVATGCYAERSPEAIAALDEIDFVIGNRGKIDLVKKITESRFAMDMPWFNAEDNIRLEPGALKTRIMIKIQEGCDQVCAYCIVPKVRGREKSIPPKIIIDRIKHHVALGYKEVVLTGTQLGTYGFDLDKVTLTVLLKRILTETNIHRLRVSSLQAQEIDNDLLEIWSDSRLCPHFHIPLQSGSPDVLNHMRRRYTISSFMRALEQIRTAVPDAAITTDVIVGFPGETQDDFDETYARCKEARFASIHVFPYSVRPGTSAAKFDNKIDPISISSRMEQLLELTKKQSYDFRQKLIGTTRQVLWEGEDGGKNRDRNWQGLTDNYVRVKTVTSANLFNQVTLAELVRLEDELVYSIIPKSRGPY